MNAMLLAAIMLCASVAQASPQEATGTIGGGCSCVVISPDGYVLTAEHCGAKDGETVTLNGRAYKAKMVHAPRKNNVDEAVLLKISSPDPFPYAPVSKTHPEAGDHVTSMGFPNGKWAESSGEILSVSATIGNPMGVFATAYTTHVNFGAAGGNSGGPLFNAEGEVIGLTSTTSPDGSRCIGWASINTATKGITFVQQFRRKPHVLFFGFEECPPCQSVKRDIKAGLLDDIDIEYVDIQTVEGNKRWVALTDAIKKANPNFKYEYTFPAFHRAGDANIVYGYNQRGGDRRLLKWVLDTIRLPLTLTEGILGLVYPKSSGTQSPPAPVPPAEDDPPSPKSTTPPNAPVAPVDDEPTVDDDPPVEAPEPEADSLMLVLLAAGMGLVETFIKKKVKP